MVMHILINLNQKNFAMCQQIGCIRLEIPMRLRLPLIYIDLVIPRM